MTNTTVSRHNEKRAMTRPMAVIVLGTASTLCQAAPHTREARGCGRQARSVCSPLGPTAHRRSHRSLRPAGGDMAKLNAALNQGLKTGLTVRDARENLVQLYAYAGLPRGFNALTELMNVLEARNQRGIQDAPGQGPRHASPKGDAVLAASTANQTK